MTSLYFLFIRQSRFVRLKCHLMFQVTLNQNQNQTLEVLNELFRQHNFGKVCSPEL